MVCLIMAHSRRCPALHHSNRRKSHIPLHSNLSFPTNYLHSQRSGSRLSLCSLLTLQESDSLNVTSSSKADRSTSGLCIKRCSCGTALIQYVLEWVMDRGSDQCLYSVNTNEDWDNN